MLSASQFKIVMLTNGNVHGIRILEALRLVGITLDAVVLETKDRVSEHLFSSEDCYAFRYAKALRRYLLAIPATKRIEIQLNKYTQLL